MPHSGIVRKEVTGSTSGRWCQKLCATQTEGNSKWLLKNRRSIRCRGNKVGGFTSDTKVSDLSDSQQKNGTQEAELVLAAVTLGLCTAAALTLGSIILSVCWMVQTCLRNREHWVSCKDTEQTGERDSTRAALQGHARDYGNRGNRLVSRENKKLTKTEGTVKCTDSVLAS